jgi:hypothetical protein
MSEYRVHSPRRLCLMLSTCRNYDEAIRVMQRASSVPKKKTVSFNDEVRPHSAPSPQSH